MNKNAIYGFYMYKGDVMEDSSETEKCMAHDTFSYGQVELAVWQTMHNPAPSPNKNTPSLTFKARCRRYREEGVPIRKEKASGVQGVHSEYEAYNAFELLMALRMSDAGMPRAEVAFFMHHTRAQLEREFERVLADPPFVAEGDFDPNKRAFLVIRYVGLQELGWRVPEKVEGWKGAGPAPLFLAPRFHHSVNSLMGDVGKMGRGGFNPPCTIIEFSETAVVLLDNLKKAPKTKRGRQK